ncbi:MAG: proteasome assembly chaperone family protein [Acidimicrobiales bacterium]|jgi:proteasome assembly chaperone (PAC2) family protein
MSIGPDSVAYKIVRDRSFDEPVLVVALEGWVDAGLGAVTALASLLSESATETIATFDGDLFLDQRARRPVAHISNGVTTELTWPRTEIRAGNDLGGSDVLYLIGPEPDFHWKLFVDAVVALSTRWGVRLLVGLGAFPAPAPHTRPVRLAATAPSASSELINRIGVIQGELEVPAGVVAALELGFEAAGIDAVSLWARVPHYVSAMAFPEASAALIDGLNKVSGLQFDSGVLRSAADSSLRQVDDLIEGNPEHQAMLRNLEQSVDASEGNALGVDAVPSGDELAAEFEKFLRGEDR